MDQTENVLTACQKLAGVTCPDSSAEDADHSQGSRWVACVATMPAPLSANCHADLLKDAAKTCHQWLKTLRREIQANARRPLWLYTAAAE